MIVCWCKRSIREVTLTSLYSTHQACNILARVLTGRTLRGVATLVRVPFVSTTRPRKLRRERAEDVVERLGNDHVVIDGYQTVQHYISDTNTYNDRQQPQMLSPVSIQTQSLALRALRLNGNGAKRKRLRLKAANHGCHCFDRASYWVAPFPSKRNARNASDCVWMETGL